jgi:heat shock protein HtpX
VSLDDFVIQFYQPYFFYSLFFLMVSFVCVEVFLRFNPYISPRNKSILYLTPLFAPVLSLIVFIPKTQISLLPTQLQVSGIFGAPVGGLIVGAAKIPLTSVISITGMMCIVGAVAAASYLAFSVLFGKKIAMKAFHVVMMLPEDYEAVQAKVKEVAQKIVVSPPKVGLTDDLRPNAFTLGYGRHTIIVFSLGILKMLDIDELAAVVSHELAHVKAKDYMFRITSCTLNILSFFNPLSYLASTSAQQERELLADEKGASLLGQPKMLTNVLTKLEKTLQACPKDSWTERLSTSLFLVSPIARRAQILAVHPQIAHRVSSINRKASFKLPKLRVITISLILILAASAVSYGVIALQTNFQQNTPHIIKTGSNSQTANIIIGSAGNLPLSPPTLPPSNTDALAPASGRNVTTIQTGPVLIINGSQIQDMP